MISNPRAFSCDGKRRYGTWTEAERDGRRAAKRHNGDRPILRPYACHWCGGVHLYSVDPVERGKRLARFEHHDE